MSEKIHAGGLVPDGVDGMVDDAHHVAVRVTNVNGGLSNHMTTPLKVSYTKMPLLSISTIFKFLHIPSYTVTFLHAILRLDD